MARKLVFAGVLYLASVAAAGVLDVRADDNKGKEPEKKPNIVKDYVCLRDGELCHPEFGKNRGLYVSCSNGVAWEQQCPRCSYHPLNCPTRTLWFDGEKCEWASPKLASQPCIDRFPSFSDMINGTEKDSAGNSISEQEALFQSLTSPMKEHAEKNNWQASSPSGYFKSPKSGDLLETAAVQEDAEEEIEVSNNVSQEKEVKVANENVAAEEDEDDSSEEEQPLSNNIERKRKSGEANEESDFPTYLNADDSLIGSKIVRLSDPVYTLVNNPDGSGKQVLMRVSKPFVLEDPARSILPNLNVISSFSDKE